jgi:hypothetical protein
VYATETPNFCTSTTTATVTETTGVTLVLWDIASVIFIFKLVYKVLPREPESVSFMSSLFTC